MIVVITTETEVKAVLSKAGKKPISMEELEIEFGEYTAGSNVETKLAKDPANLTKSGTIKSAVLRKELKKRDISFIEFLTINKKFKVVDFQVFEE